MFEWLAWDTRNILGISKTDYCKVIVDWVWGHEGTTLSAADVLKDVRARVDAELAHSEQEARFAPPRQGIASAREALRRAKYFSEDYLNKEFDIFMSLQPFRSNPGR